MRTALEEKIHKLQDDILVLGSMVEEAMRDALEALKRRDIEASRQVYRTDAEINAKRFAIEQETLVAIATQQPMAHDLRVLASILEITSELERMGDYAKGIARINILMGEQSLLKPLIDLPRMVEIATGMLRRALIAFVEGDVEAARTIPKEDDVVDALYNQIYRELVTFMIQDPRTIDQANYLLWAAHNVERMADRVTNICERTIFTVTGEMRELDVSDDEWNPPKEKEESMTQQKRKVLFLCTGNSCRSQMAEALTNARYGDRWEAYSAGTAPAGYVHPKALQVLAEIGISHQGRSKHVDEFRGMEFDLVVTVCDKAKESCPVWLGKGVQIHRGFPDPAEATGSEEEVLAVFRAVRDAIAEMLEEVLNASPETLAPDMNAVFLL